VRAVFTNIPKRSNIQYLQYDFPTKADWLIPAGLTALGFIPIAAGAGWLINPAVADWFISGECRRQRRNRGKEPQHRGAID
jgi:hypothetical protein